MLRVPLPYPATPENYVRVAPPGLHPWTWRPIAPEEQEEAAENATAATTPFSENRYLSTASVRLFEARVFGSESVTFDPTDPTGSRLVMLDQYGAVWEARHKKKKGRAAAAAAKRLLSSVLGGGSGEGDDTNAAEAPSPAQEQQEDEFQLNPTPVAWLGAGRPLGAAFHPRTGALVVCDALKGLLAVEKNAQRPTLLANHVSSSSSLEPGTPIRYCNDVAISSDGSTAYFTDSVDVTIQRMRLGNGAATDPRGVAGGRPGSAAHVYDTKTGWAIGMAQAKPSGRLLAYDFASGRTRVVARGFCYANGVALPEGEAFVAVSETDRLRVVRVPLPTRASAAAKKTRSERGGSVVAEPPLETEGQPEGQPALVTADEIELAPELVEALRKESGEGEEDEGAAAERRPTVLIRHLPGVPDGLATAADGQSFWLSMVVKPPRVSRHFGPAAVRALMAWLPRTLRPRPVRWGGAALVDARSGQVRSFLMDPKGERVATISAAHEHDGRLYFGNLDLDYVAFAPVPAEGSVGVVVGGGGGRAAAGGGTRAAASA
jgi:sugar lactone lactonase YvrE